MVGFMRNGKLIEENNPETLLTKYKENVSDNQCIKDGNKFYFIIFSKNIRTNSNRFPEYFIEYFSGRNSFATGR